MKVLILSCNTGGGHNSCARAIGTELQRRGHTYETDDALLYVSKGTSRFVSNWHVRFYRYFPKLYNKGYQYAEEHRRRLTSRLRPAASCGAGASGCARPSCRAGYDAVVCVHLFPALMLTFIQRQQPAACQDHVHRHGLHRKSLLRPDAAGHLRHPRRVAARGIRKKRRPAGDHLPCGIPVREELYTCLPNREAKLAVGLEPSHRASGDDDRQHGLRADGKNHGAACKFAPAGV